jgi:hypothetical protein
MKKYFILFSVTILLLTLLCGGCKALAVNGNNGEDGINVVGVWSFVNSLKTNESETHTRSFTLAGDKSSGTVTDNLATAVGTYTVTGETAFVMKLTDYDASYSWTFDYTGTISDNRNMTGTLLTTTFTPDGSEKLAEYEYNFTATRQN